MVAWGRPIVQARTARRRRVSRVSSDSWRGLGMVSAMTLAPPAQAGRGESHPLTVLYTALAVGTANVVTMLAAGVICQAAYGGVTGAGDDVIGPRQVRAWSGAGRRRPRWPPGVQPGAGGGQRCRLRP